MQPDASTHKRLDRSEATEFEMVVKPPKLEVHPGESFVLETEDSELGLFRSPEDLPTPERFGARWHTGESNPCAGPVYVHGAEAGDVLVVHVERIVVDDQGFTCLIPGIGPLADSARYPECAGPYTHIVRHLPGPSGTTADGVGVFDEQTRWNLLPHIGTIGTAPARPIAAGADTTFGQGPHGGNIDCRDIRAGHQVLLPVEVDGAYLYVGDVHGSQGDAEYYAVANETRAEVTLRCELLKAKRQPGVRIITPERIIQLHSARPLEAAVGQCFEWLLDWLVDDFGVAPRDAYLQLGINPDVRIHVYQMTALGRLNFTAGVSFPRRRLAS